jgi:hypothetical protein
MIALIGEGLRLVQRDPGSEVVPFQLMVPVSRTE